MGVNQHFYHYSVLVLFRQQYQTSQHDTFSCSHFMSQSCPNLEICVMLVPLLYVIYDVILDVPRKKLHLYLLDELITAEILSKYL